MAEVQRKGTFYLIFLGALLGFAASCILAPKLISWYSEPPYQMGVNCTPAIEWAMTQIIRWQIGMMLVFMAVMGVLAFIVKRKRVIIVEK